MFPDNLLDMIVTIQHDVKIKPIAYSAFISFYRFLVRFQHVQSDTSAVREESPPLQKAMLIALAVAVAVSVKRMPYSRFVHAGKQRTLNTQKKLTI